MPDKELLDSTLLRCEKCNTPVFAVGQGSIIIDVSHHGKRHISKIEIRDLVDFYFNGSPIEIGPRIYTL